MLKYTVIYLPRYTEQYWDLYSNSEVYLDFRKNQALESYLTATDLCIELLQQKAYIARAGALV